MTETWMSHAAERCVALSLDLTQAERGIKRALAKGYITRRRIGARGYEYAIRWKGSN